ncbi:PIN domain-containing protein [Paenibacillus sp. VCA1]|uniref:PIN domain-containing protein n=1 Tax=Paenibacillus sp. VCA1 TaxID=3039148 RepID=UPI00287156C9|nr:PIN domain-containing protein [Paenibacillus sp. VCA1]MDR9852043.1 PIN domain-containing protein [Paenibacillus sp. VCA1]
MSRLLTSNVFIDSSIYIGRNFAFRDHLLGQVAKLANSSHIKLFISEIVINEVRNKIDEKSKEAKSALDTLRKKGMVLRHVSHYNSVFNIEFSNSINPVLLNNFEEFLQYSRVTIVSVDTVLMSKLLHSYFQGTAPFSSTKKSEFPDAINLMALDNWCKDNCEQMYVISSDNDLANYCAISSNLHYLDSVDAFLNLVTSSDEYRHTFVTKLTEARFEEVEEIISENFKWLGFSLENEDGYVENVKVLSVELEDDINVIELQEDTATLQFEVRVNFEAEVTYTDYANSVYDKEEGKYLLEEEIELEVENDVLIPVSVQIGYKISDETYLEVVSCKVNEDQDVSFMLYEEDY